MPVPKNAISYVLDEGKININNISITTPGYGYKIGDNLGEQAFSKWLQTQSKGSVAKKDPVAEKLHSAISSLASDSSLRLGTKGYTIKRARGKGASGFIINKNT